MDRFEEIIRFWFIEHGRDDWFSGSADFDAVLAARFAETHARVSLGEAFAWRAAPEGRLAEIIVLDQFSRQLHRGKPQAFAQDGMALVLAQEAVAQGFDKLLPVERRSFLYMPYMHSESLVIQDQGLPLFESLGDDELVDFARRHRDVIARFGRYPRRNTALGRASGEAELAYVASGKDMF